MLYVALNWVPIVTGAARRSVGVKQSTDKIEILTRLQAPGLAFIHFHERSMILPLPAEQVWRRIPHGDELYTMQKLARAL